MAAINGANRGLGLVTHGLETDFPEDDRNTLVSTVDVRSGISWLTRNVAYTGTATIGMASASDAPLLLETTVKVNR